MQDVVVLHKNVLEYSLNDMRHCISVSVRERLLKTASDYFTTQLVQTFAATQNYTSQVRADFLNEVLASD